MNTTYTTQQQQRQQQTDTLGARAADVAMRSAVAYFRQAGRLGELQGAAVEALTARLRLAVVAALDGALADAREALECGNEHIALATFSASMALAGIDAARAAIRDLDDAEDGIIWGEVVTPARDLVPGLLAD